MTNERQIPTGSEICRIQIAFPVVNDEQAIGYKKKISEVLADIPDVRIEFSLMEIPRGKRV